MRHVKYTTYIDGKLPKKLFVSRHLKDKDEALEQAKLLDSYDLVVRVYEVVTDVEGVVSNKMIFDSSDD